MQHATATYEQINATTAIVTVEYANGGFGMERVEIKRGSLYEAAYNAASVKATMQGETLGRFSRA
jgi:hypothetical protein